MKSTLIYTVVCPTPTLPSGAIDVYIFFGIIIATVVWVHFSLIEIRILIKFNNQYIIIILVEISKQECRLKGRCMLQ